MRRAAIIGLLVLAGLVALIAGATAWLIGTESGLRFALSRAMPYLPDGLEISGVRGEIAGPVVVQDLRLETEGFVLELDRVELQWRLAELLGRQLFVDRLDARGLRFSAREKVPPPEEAEPFALPERLDLPVEIFVREAFVREVAIRAGPGAQPLRVDTVRVQAQWTARALELAALEVHAPLVDLQATAQIVPRGDYPLEAELAYTLKPPGYAPLEGRTQLDGSLQTLELKQTLAPPYNLRAGASLRDVVEGLSFDANVEVEEAALARIDDTLPAATLSARLQAGGDLAAIRVKLSASGIAPELGPVNAEFAGQLSPELIAIERLVIELTGEAGHLEATGRIELAAPQPTVDIDAEWSDLKWPLRGEPRIASASGRLNVLGTLDNYDARLAAGLSVPNQADGHVRLSGSGNSERFELRDVDIETLEGEVNGTASIQWNPVLAGRVDLRGRGLDPGGLLSGWPGSIDITVRGEASVPETGLVAHVQALRAEGELRGFPVALNARGAFEDETLSLENFDLRSGSTRIEADGRIGKALELSWSLASEDLGTLLPQAGGSLQGQGEATGTLSEPQLSAGLSGSDLSYAEYRLASLDLDADVDVSGDSRSQLDLELGDGSLAGIEIETLALTGVGTRRDHTLVLEARTNVGQVELGIAGDLEPDLAWRFVLERLDYAYGNLPSWSLREPAAGHLASDSARIDRLCLGSQEASLCLQGERAPQQLAAAFELNNLPLELANPFLPKTVSIKGSIGGSGSLEMMEANGPVARIDLRTSPLSLHALDAEQAMQPVLEFATGRIALEMSDAIGAELLLDLPLEAQGGIEAEATIAAGGGPLSERSLAGRLLAELPDIGFLVDFVPQVSSLAGELAGDIRVDGTLAAPAINGSLELNEGNAFLVAPEIRLREVRASISGRGASGLAVEARAASGGGSLEIDGDLDLLGEQVSGRLSVVGNDFRVLNTNEAEVYVSPDLDLELAGDRLEVAGMVRVPRADIEIEEAPQSAVGVSDDQVIVTLDEPSAATGGLEVTAEVRVVLGPEVDFQGFGLTARFAGDLTVIEQPGEPTTATGEISVAEGGYEAYGQSLDIETGRILFAGGPIDQPGIDVRAVRRPAEDILVGVQARGNLRRPEFTLFSEPSMSESEQLSYLVLGRPLEGGPASENSVLARAALALGIKGGNFLTDQLGGKLGVDQIGIETEPGQSNEQAALVVGKYLSPKLYVSYGVGLLEPVSTLRLQYTLNSKWRVVTESSSLQSGGDLLYSIER